MNQSWDRDKVGDAFARHVRKLYTTLYSPLNPRSRNWATIGAAFVFLIVAGVSIHAIGGISLRPRFLLLGAVLTYILQLGNSAEYRVFGVFLRQQVGWLEALEITTLATAANLLPIPGGALVRIREMGGRAKNLQSAMLATALIGVFWLSAGSAIASIGLSVLGRALPALAFGLVSLGTLSIGVVVATNRMEARLRTVVNLVTIELLLCMTAALRIALVMAGVGIEVSIPLAMVFSVSGPMAALLGFFPGGLGLQELIAGLLAPVAAVAPEFGAASIAADRIVGYTAMAVGACVIWSGARARRRSGHRLRS